jgi:hypothetical protein
MDIGPDWEQLSAATTLPVLSHSERSRTQAYRQTSPPSILGKIRHIILTDERNGDRHEIARFYFDMR